MGLQSASSLARVLAEALVSFCLGPPIGWLTTGQLASPEVSHVRSILTMMEEVTVAFITSSQKRHTIPSAVFYWPYTQPWSSAGEDPWGPL